jgi:chromosome segregation ATPase
MENQAIFKGSLFGFSKKDVISFIDASNKTANEVQEKLNAQIDSLTNDRVNLQSQIATFEEKISELENQISLQQETIDQLTGKISELTDTVEKQQSIIEKQEQDLQEQLQRNDILSVASEALEEKSRKYDDLASRIGNVILEAEKNAQTIVETAQKKSNEINSDTDVTILEFSNVLSLLKSDVQNLKKDLHNTMSTIEIRLDDLSNAIDSTKTRISLFSSDKASSFSNQLNNDKSSQLTDDQLNQFFR